MKITMGVKDVGHSFSIVLEIQCKLVSDISFSLGICIGQCAIVITSKTYLIYFFLK